MAYSKPGAQRKAVAEDGYASLISAIDTAERESYGSEQNSLLAEDRARAIELYLGENTDPAPEGRSQVVSRDVFDTIEWIKPALIRVFTGGDDLATFEPTGPEDEAGADQESAYINHVVTQQNPWYRIFGDWCTDALMLKNGYALAYWEEAKTGEKESYDDQSEDVVALLLSDPNVELLQADVKLQPDGTTRLIDVVIRRIEQRGRICIKVLPPERCKISMRTPDRSLRDCPYFEYWEEKTLSELKEMGLKLPEIYGSDGISTFTQEEQARNQFNERDQSSVQDWADESMRRVTARMVWIRADMDGDGIAELIYCIRVGSSILYAEEVPSIDVGVLCPGPLPHRHIGMSIADVVGDVQEIKTVILRQGLDNLYQSNNPRMGASEHVVLDDLLTSVPGGVVRIMDGQLPGAALSQIVVPNVFPQVMQGLEYMDQIRENRTGTNRYFTGVDQNSLNKTASGIAQLTSSAAQRVEMITRHFADAIAEFMLLVHGLILRHGHQQQVTRLRNKWVTVDPSQWKTRTDMQVAVGVAAGNRQQLTAQIMQTLQMQMQFLPLGVTDAQHVYNTLAELSKAQGFSNADKFWLDPSKRPPQQQQQGPPPALAIEMEKLKLEREKAQSDVQMDAAKMQADQAIQAARLRQDGELAREKMALDARMKMGMHGQSLSAEVAQAQAVAVPQQDALATAIAALAQATQMLAQASVRLAAAETGAQQ